MAYWLELEPPERKVSASSPTAVVFFPGWQTGRQAGSQTGRKEGRLAVRQEVRKEGR